MCGTITSTPNMPSWHIQEQPYASGWAVILIGQGYHLKELILLPIGFRRPRLLNMGQGYTKNRTD